MSAPRSEARRAPSRRWRRCGPLLVLPRWPVDVEVLACRLGDPCDAECEFRRIETKSGVTADDVNELRELAGGAR